MWWLLLFISSVPAQGQPQLSPSPDGHHGSQQTSTMLCLYLATPAPQNCTRTFPNLKIPAQPLPTPADSCSPPVLTSQLKFLPPHPSFHPIRFKSCLILCGSSFLTRPTELLCHSILWPPCSSFWDPLLPRKEAHFFLSNCDVLGAQKRHDPSAPGQSIAECSSN